MRKNKLLSVVLSACMLFTSLAFTVTAAPKTVSVNLTAQQGGKFLCPPQFSVSVSQNEAEDYGFTDNVTDGVSVLDGLVKLHEIKYGEDFTPQTAANYLVEDGGTVEKLFGTKTGANGFVHNGGYPNTGEPDTVYGGYCGTTVRTQALADGDVTDFFIYQDQEGWSDELSWFVYGGNAGTAFDVPTDQDITFTLNSISYLMGYAYKDAAAMYQMGSAVGGAQLAWVNADGTLTPVSDSGITAADGKVTIHTPKTEQTLYLTAYIPNGTEGEPLILQLTKLTVAEAKAQDPCALTALSVTSFEANPNALALTPAFAEDVYEYTVPQVAYPSMDLGVYRSLYVQATAASAAAKVTAECNGVSADITGKTGWQFLNGALAGGKDNVLTVTVAASDEENAATQKYTVTVPMAKNPNAPTALTLGVDSKNKAGSKVVAKKGDTFSLTAQDENGKTTKVTWKNTTKNGGGVSLNETTGVVTVDKDIYQGDTASLSFTATSAYDTAVTKKLTVSLAGYLLSDAKKTQAVALSADGQTEKTCTLSGGQNGYNVWNLTIPQGVGAVQSDPKNGQSVKLKLYRPGQIKASYSFSFDESMGDTFTVNVNGVAVEDTQGNRQKVYLSVTEQNPNPTVQLAAYTEADKTVSAWASSNTAVAEVDKNGLVTAKGVGNAMITCTDSANQKGGIKVVVQSTTVPYFESLDFTTTSLATGVWEKGVTFAPTKLSYDLLIKNYTTSALMLMSTTLYDTEKYTATADYTNASGKPVTILVASGAATSLPDQPFGTSTLTVTLAEKENPANKTVYTFAVTRPRDTTKKLKDNGITFVPQCGVLSAITYNGKAEGTLEVCDENGKNPQTGAVNGGNLYYRGFLYDTNKTFRAMIAASTKYAHIRISQNNGEAWQELAQGEGTTPFLTLTNFAETPLLIQIADDDAYAKSVAGGGDGFADTTPVTYRVWMDAIAANLPKMLTANLSVGEIHPRFAEDIFDYTVMVPNGGSAPQLTYTVSAGCTVTVDDVLQTPDENGNYSLTLAATTKKAVITSADGKSCSSYGFAYKEKSALDVPDRVADYLCIGSQYTNGGYGVKPELTLSGNLKSLGNYGGYITYYYDTPLTDNPNNKYGMDFYVVGNSSESNIDSMAEAGQVYVSEDGNTWYALAGSEHYEKNTLWDYTITYRKGDDQKSYWTDNYGNTMPYSPLPWPSASVYPENNVAKQNEYTFRGVLLPCQDGTVTGDGTTGSYAARTRFGYADYYASNISGKTVKDVNSYVENPSQANGFDLAWAVDENGMPVDVSQKAFHYVKVATASNIHAGVFREKSTEVSYVVRTTAQNTAVGKTDAPVGVCISDGTETKEVYFRDGQTVYEINVDNMKYVSVSAIGTAEDDNIYINNQRVKSGTFAEGFKVTQETGDVLIRVLVQNGEKEPTIRLLKLCGTADESTEVLESIKINANGSVREATTKNGEIYTAEVGARVENISIGAVCAPGVKVTVNGAPQQASYPLSYGENVFEITAQDGRGNTQTIQLKVIRDVPASSGNTGTIRVSFTLYGDETHGVDKVHTYRQNKKDLPVWIPKTTFTVSADALVVDVFETALRQAGLSWKNPSGNYVSEINGLAEFSNGALSGWMYLINGEHATRGVAEQSLRDGDSIVMHYTDDYTKEEGSEKWSGTGGGVGASTYKVTFDTCGGSAVSPQTVKKNDTVQMPNPPEKEGYTFGGWCTDSKAETLYDFTAKVTKSFTLYAKWEPKTENTTYVFADVLPNMWYTDAVAYVTNKNLFRGVSDTEFAPDEHMTRAMLVTVLYRMQNNTAENTQNPFADVEETAWYADAVLWAVENNIVKGIDKNIFAPDAPVTREQLATILYRWANIALDRDNAQILSGYQDCAKIGDWAQNAMAWAVAEGILSGVTQDTLVPDAYTTRAQVATVLYRYLKK